MRRSIVPLVLVLSLATPTFVRATEPTSAELAAARELFAKGVQQEEAHDWAGALETFRKVAAVKTTAAVHFHLGLCLENTGKLVDALNEFHRANESTGADDPDAKLLLEKSKKHMNELEARVPRVTVEAPRDVDGIEVTLDDGAIGPTLFGAPIPVDPGAHVVRAKAPRRLPFERSFDAKEKETAHVSVALPIDPNAPSETSVPPPKTTHSVRAGPGVLPWIVGGVGVVALGGAAWMFVARSNALSDLESVCPSHHDCPPDAQSTYDRGRRDAILGDVFLGVGVVAVTTSVLLFTLGGDHEEPTTSIAVSPFGVNVLGTF